ncbi:MAG: histidinol phosphate phosphatase domain-containing protein [Methanomassiliicoccales archaeon]
MRIDLHTHTLLSDGELLPIEMARRAEVMGMGGIAFTDHVSASNIDRVVEEIRRDCELAEGWEIETVAGVEITHVPVDRIDHMVARARKLGAELIVVHGETLVEPVQRGTNLKAVENPEVDILAHPGLLDPEEADLARDNGVLLELTARKGHSLSNGLVARMALEAGAELVINTDAHVHTDLIDEHQSMRVALGSGMSMSQAERAVQQVPSEVIRRIKGR